MTYQTGTPRLSVRFWGVRGSIPTPQVDNLSFGGNTTCLQISVPGSSEALVIDGGTGLRLLGEELGHLPGHPVDEPIQAHVLMTHFHQDHIQGIPFFGPLFHASNKLLFYSERECNDVKNILERQMASPYFPLPFNLAAAQREFFQLQRTPVKVAGATVINFPLNHPQGACGYRIESGGAVIVHASDHEHSRESIDHELRSHCEEADVLIYDAQYTPEEYPCSADGGIAPTCRERTWRRTPA
jgi:phosphoribosyl 1,2-cyclic phosphodiesterase